MLRFTKESMKEVKKLVGSYDFKFYGDVNKSMDLVICSTERDRITVRKEIGYTKGVMKAGINWSAIGEVNLEEAEIFSQNLQKALSIARLLDSDLKTEESEDI